MSKRKERTLQDICDATSTLFLPQIPVLRKNCRMQGSVDKPDHIHMVTPQIKKGFSSCSDKSQKVDYRGKSRTCNVCSAPCSSCFHINQVLMKAADESAEETWAENIEIDRGKRREIGQLSEMSTVEAMISTSDSSENVVGKASSRTSDASASNDTVVHSKFEAQKVPEGYDDCLSCDSGTNEASKVLTFAIRKVDRINLPCSSVSTSCPVVQDDDHQTLSEHGNKKSDIEYGRINYSRQSKLNGEFSDKAPSSSLPIGLSSRYPGLFEIPASKSTDDATDTVMVHDTSSVQSLLCDPNSRDMEDVKRSAPQGKPLEGLSEHLDSLLTREVVTDVCGDLPATALKSIEKNDDMEVEIHPTDETDDSDMVEQDVKVCDICGDAGREDLLAICCRCSDGAEHTYCMREMLAKVPEGDWLCEECKFGERMRYQRQDKIGRVDENEKNNSSGQVSSEHVHSSDAEGNRTSGCLKVPGKRLRDDADGEVSSTVKKQAVESIVGSPKPSRSNKTAALSRENSLKNLDKGRGQSSYGGPVSDTVSVKDTPELARSASDLRVQNFRGTFSKSFTSLISKPKVKLVDHVLQRQKSVRDLAPLRLKEGAIRSLGNSMSFKSTNIIRSESKVKMLSPRLSHIQDIKYTKQRSSVDRQSSFKSEHVPINSMMATSMSSATRSDKKLASGVEPCSLSIPINHQETKPVQPDGKSVALSRSSSLAARRSTDLSSSLGEFKRPSLYGHSTPGASSANGVSNIDKKSNHNSPKEDSSSCSGVSERPPFNINEGLPDGLSHPRELTNSGESLREYSGSRFRPSYVNSPRDENNNLKAAIEAAVLRKPGVYRKHRSDDSSASSMGCDILSKDHLSSSAGRRIESSAAEVVERHTVSRNLTADSLKHETLNTVKHFSLIPIEALSSGGDEVRIVPLDGKSSSRDVFSNVAAAVSSLKSLAIPEHEYIWQGSFEICRSGKIFVLWDGIQAHLSACTSPKVIEAVNKFKSRIVLNEVPRLSTWPIQFQEHGVGEDNIALFFFAKDLESYDKIYKVWLENMMKNDLALKANLNGVELLIFPSNQLPENSQRWNMLFFLWGVFRGKKESCLQHTSDSLKQFSAPRNLPPAIMSLPENRCSLRPIAKDFPACDDVSPELRVHASEESCSLLSTRAVNEDCGVKLSSLDWLASRQNSSSSTAVRGARAKELRDTCLDRGISSSSRPLQAVLSIGGSGREQTLMQLDTPLDRQQSSHHFDKSPEEGIGETTVLDEMTHSQDQEKFRMDAEDLSTDTRGLNTELNRWPLNRKEYLHPESTCMVPRALYATTSQVLPKNDDTHNKPHRALEKMNHVASGSREVENRCHETCDETVIPEHSENAERHFFPMELHPVKGTRLVDRSMPWKIHPSEQNRLHDRVPNLELALGAERKPFTQGIQPLMVAKVERKITEEHILDETAIKTEEDDDDVSAALSLSLSFPFHEEQTTKPVRKAEQLVSQRDHVNTSMLLFRDLGD